MIQTQGERTSDANRIAGKTRGRVARVLRGAGRTGLSRSADLSRAVCGAAILVFGDEQFACGAAHAAGPRGADYTAASGAAVRVVRPLRGGPAGTWRGNGNGGR